jgi:hypothetical protein
VNSNGLQTGLWPVLTVQRPMTLSGPQLLCHPSLAWESGRGRPGCAARCARSDVGHWHAWQCGCYWQVGGLGGAAAAAIAPGALGEHAGQLVVSRDTLVRSGNSGVEKRTVRRQCSGGHPWLRSAATPPREGEEHEVKVK